MPYPSMESRSRLRKASTRLVYLSLDSVSSIRFFGHSRDQPANGGSNGHTCNSILWVQDLCSPFISQQRLSRNFVLLLVQVATMEFGRMCLAHRNNVDVRQATDECERYVAFVIGSVATSLSACTIQTRVVYECVNHNQP
ncbi:hypothetical protein QCA50_016398 [Cerrena zonata]|uniref:Uncharacterized protein n=1 Tax=Cerrena zonata TaxID=2478898 RepID=A0AAW0FJ40_9APHY